MRYLLDTNVVIALLNDASSRIAQNVRLRVPAEIGISSIVIHELFYGAFQSRLAKDNVALIEELQFEVLDFDKADAYQAGEIRAILASLGSPIGPYDVLIAGQAKSRDITLITSNVREFERVKGLRVENWGS